MKWVNHIAIAAATTAVFNPLLIPIAVAGSTAPDWLEWLPRLFGGRTIKHRTTTHYVVLWIAALVGFLTVWDFHGIGAAFAWGGLSHVLCDALTASGVPLGWWSDRRFHILGGRLKTGMMGEYWVSGGVVVLCCVLIYSTRSYQGGFVPFFYDYAGYYQDGTIDAKEWRERRLVFF